jgi:flagellar motor switch protein FliM
LTPLEEAVAGSVIGRLLGALRETWQSGGALEAIESETHPLLLELESSSASLLVATFAVALGPVAGDLHLALPPPLLLDRLIPDSARPAGTAATTLAQLENVPVSVTAELATRPFLLSSILRVQPGDVIDTGVPAGAPVRVRLDGHPVGSATLGIQGRQLAVRLV